MFEIKVKPEVLKDKTVLSKNPDSVLIVKEIKKSGNKAMRAGLKELEEGNKVRITVKFRGREMSYTKLGEETMNQIITGLEDIASVEKAPKMEGRNMLMFLAPKKN